MIPSNTSDDFLVCSSRKTTSTIQEEITIEESKNSTPIEIIDEDPFEKRDETLSPPLPTWPVPVVTNRRPSHHTVSTSSMIHPLNPPHPIYGRRNTIFTFDQQPQPEEELPKKTRRKISEICCVRGVKISHVLLLLFIIQGLIGLIPSFILMVSSGNSVLERVSTYQAQQTQSYINFEIGKIVNVSNLVIQEVKFELENGFAIENLTEWAILVKYLRSIYVNKAPLTTVQFGNYLHNYTGTLDIPAPTLILINGSTTLQYNFRISDNLFENPFQNKYFKNCEEFTFDLHERPWYAPFKEGVSGEQRWSDVYVSTIGEPSLSVAYPIYVKENISAALNSGKNLKSLDLRVCDCKHTDHLFGVVAEVFALKGLNTFLNTTSTSYNFISYSFIMQSNGTLIASSRFNMTKNHVSIEDDEIMELAVHIRSRELLVHRGKESITFKFKGKNVVISLVEDPYGLSLALVVGSFDADIFKELLSSGMTSVVVFIVILVAGSLVLFVTVQLFAQPLNNVHKKLSKILSDKNLAKDNNNSKITTAGQIFSDIGEMESGINSLKRGVSAFSKFVSPTIMKKVINDEHYLDVGLILQNMTILVSNINDFTQLAEQTETLIFVSIMTDYFGSLTKVMEDHRGLIDMINGDRLQVVWNDSSMPVEDHEIRACKCAMEALEVIEELNNSWKSDNQIDCELSICMSISSGNMMYGSMGSENRLNFTAVGDDVNIGSKLQSLNRYYGSRILISENTYQHVKNEFVCYFADYVLLKGRETPTRIYSLESSRSEATDLQIKISKDLEMAHDYMFQNNYRAMYDICERLSLISPSKILTNLIKKAKRKIT